MLDPYPDVQYMSNRDQFYFTLVCKKCTTELLLIGRLEEIGAAKLF